jgi:uncharacterized protein (DUF433 family)
MPALVDTVNNREQNCGMSNNWIESNPAVMMGKPVVKGTRVTVELILEKLAAGETIEEVIESHPRLTREAVLAALEFAARALKADVVYPVATEAA